MPETTRTVSVRIPWSGSQGQAPPQSARLHVRFAPTAGGNYDDPFPVLFHPADLKPVEEKAGGGVSQTE